jgi:hypothetical protein
MDFFSSLLQGSTQEDYKEIYFVFFSSLIQFIMNLWSLYEFLELKSKKEIRKKKGTVACRITARGLATMAGWLCERHL